MRSFQLNKSPRRKQRGINCALQSAGFQPAFAPRGRGIKPAEIKKLARTSPTQATQKRQVIWNAKKNTNRA